MTKFLGSGEIGAVHYTRTTTSIRRHANQENEKQNPKPRRRIKLFNVGVLILLIPLSECVCVCVCVCLCSMHSVCGRINAWVPDLLAQPLFSDLV